MRSLATPRNTSEAFTTNLDRMPACADAAKQRPTAASEAASSSKTMPWLGNAGHVDTIAVCLFSLAGRALVAPFADFEVPSGFPPEWWTGERECCRGDKASTPRCRPGSTSTRIWSKSTPNIPCLCVSPGVAQVAPFMIFEFPSGTSPESRTGQRECRRGDKAGTPRHRSRSK